MGGRWPNKWQQSTAQSTATRVVEAVTEPPFVLRRGHAFGACVARER